MAMRSFQHTVPARVGLLGNPSDLYEGTVIGFALADFSATVKLVEAHSGGVQAMGPAAELLGAAWKRIERRLPVDAPTPHFALTAETGIPLQVGLSGSSAIVVAALCAMEECLGLHSTPFELAEEALAVETEELGLLAGPQDRVIQVYGGLLCMDFSNPRSAERYQQLDPGLLPPLLVAWNPNPGEASGTAHQLVYEAWQAEDVATRAGMSAIGDLARDGYGALIQRDAERLGQLIDRNFDHRRELFGLDSAASAPVELARQEGAAAKFCGSGGAVVALARDQAHLTRLGQAYEAFGWHSVRPCVAPASAR